MRTIPDSPFSKAQNIRKSQLTTNHSGRLPVPSVITNCFPCTIVKYFDSSLVAVLSVY